MQLTELQIETIIAETCGTYRTGGSYTFEDVWNCIEKALAAHNAGAQEPIYQVRRNGMDKWIDVTHEAYELRNYGQYERRIVYTQPQPMQQTDASNHRAPIEAIEYALHADEGLEFLRCWQHGEFDSCRDEWPDAPEVCYPSAPMTDAARDLAFEITPEIASEWARRQDIEHVLKDFSTQRCAIEDARTLHLTEIGRGEREGE